MILIVILSQQYFQWQYAQVYLEATIWVHFKQNVCWHGNIFGSDISSKQIGHSSILEIELDAIEVDVSILNVLFQSG